MSVPIGVRHWWRRPRVRLSLRALMIAVLILGVWLGWMVRGARIRREAVAAIERGRGSVRYDGQARGSVRESVAKGLWRLFGDRGRDYWDYFFNVEGVWVGYDEPDRVMRHVARLGRLKMLFITEQGPPVPDEGESPPTGFTGSSLASLEGLTGLRRLWVDRAPPLTDADLAHLEGLTSLDTLRLPGARGGRVTDAGLASLAGLTAMRFLHLENHVGLTSLGLARLRGMSRLGVLEMSGTRVDDLAPIAHLTGLTLLRLGRTRITDAGLAPVAGFTGLTVLDLEGTAITDAGLEHLRGLSRLKHLRLGGTRVTDAGLRHLAGLSPLVSLELHGTGITDAGLVHLAGLTSLQNLDLAGADVRGPGLVHLAGLGSLCELNLCGTHVDDAGLAHLAGLGSLTTLALARTRVTADGVRPVLRLPRVKELVIDEELTKDPAIAAIRRAPGRCSILTGNNLDPYWFGFHSWSNPGDRR